MNGRFGIVVLTILAVITAGVAADLGGVVFKEDFAKYEVGDPITDWGTSDIVVLKTADDKTWIQAQTPGQHKAEKRLKLPDSFVFTFNVTHPLDFDLLFIDNSEETHLLNFKYNPGASSSLKVTFQDTITKEVDRFGYNNVHGIKIVKKNKTFKLFIDDSFVLSSTPQALGQVGGIAFKIQPETKIGNIEITELIVE